MLPRAKIDHTASNKIFFFATRSYKEGGRLSRSMMKKILTATNNRKPTKFTYCFETILFNVICSALYQEIYDLRVPFAMAVGHQSTFNELFGRVYTKAVIKSLKGLGYVTEQTGYKSKGHKIGIASKFMATDKFIALIQDEIFEPTVQIADLIAIKNDLGNGSRGFKKELKHTGTVLTQVNDLIDNCSLSINKVVEIASQKSLLNHLTSARTENNLKGASFREIELTTELCKFRRVYSEKIGQGGRLVSGIQQLPREERFSLKIDGCETVEYDFSSLHPNICYALEGLKPPADPYDIPGVYRSVAKQILVTSLNSKDRASAIASVRWENTKRAATLPEDLKMAFTQSEQLNKPIVKHFYTESWKHLQHTESNMALDIMKHFTDKGILCIGIHDSFIVKEEYGVELQEVMKDVFLQHLESAKTAPKIARNDSKELLVKKITFLNNEFKDEVDKKDAYDTSSFEGGSHHMEDLLLDLDFYNQPKVNHLKLITN